MMFYAGPCYVLTKKNVSSSYIRYLQELFSRYKIRKFRYEGDVPPFLWKCRSSRLLFIVLNVFYYILHCILFYSIALYRMYCTVLYCTGRGYISFTSQSLGTAIWRLGLGLNFHPKDQRIFRSKSIQVISVLLT